MLKFLRKKGVAKKVLWVLAVVIILSFGVFGTANYLQFQQGAVSDAGKIFGKKVSFDDFEKSFQHARYQNILRYGDNYQKISQFLNLESEAWDRLILLHEAKKRKIKIPDEEVIKAIQDFEFFKQNGAFSRQIYEDILRYVFRCHPRDFEEMIRESLVFAKLYEGETTKIQTSEQEIYDEYKKRNEKVSVSYTLIPAEDYSKDAALDPKEIEDFYNKNKDNFFVPPSINIEYILIPFLPEIKKEEQSAVKSEIEEIAKQLKNTPDLKTVSKENNLEVSETGFFSREQPRFELGLPFETLHRLFEVKTDEIIGPEETTKGYYFLRVKEERGSYLSDFKEATPKITEALSIQKGKEIAKTKAEEYLKQIQEKAANDPSADFAAIIKDLDLKLTTIPAFSRGQYLPELAVAKEFEDAAFSLSEQKKISGVLEVPQGYAIVHLDSFAPIDENKFKEEKTSFSETLDTEKKNETFSQFVTDLKLQANPQDNISKLKAAQNKNPSNSN